MTKTFRKPAIILFLSIMAASCGGLKGIKIPDDKKDYVGTWKSEEVTLTIWEGGRVEYEKKTDGSSKKISAPIQKFDGDNFIVGALGINTTFVVSSPPAKDSSGVWKMTVDGAKLTKE